MNEHTKLELLKIAATLTSAKYQNNDDIKQVFKDCYLIAINQYNEDTTAQQSLLSQKDQLAYGVITV